MGQRQGRGGGDRRWFCSHADDLCYGLVFDDVRDAVHLKSYLLNVENAFMGLYQFHVNIICHIFFHHLCSNHILDIVPMFHINS